MTTLGIIIGNRGFFPAHLCETGRREILRVLEQEGIKAVTLPAEATKFGAVESLADAQKCADLFKAHREEIDGVLVTLPNFVASAGKVTALIPSCSRTRRMSRRPDSHKCAGKNPRLPMIMPSVVTDESFYGRLYIKFLK